MHKNFSEEKKTTARHVEGTSQKEHSMEKREAQKKKSKTNKKGIFDMKVCIYTLFFYFRSLRVLYNRGRGEIEKSRFLNHMRFTPVPFEVPVDCLRS